MNMKAMGFLTWMLLLAIGIALAAPREIAYASLRESPPLPLGSSPAAAPTVVGSVQLASVSEGVGDIAVNPNTDRVYVSRYIGVSDISVKVVNASDPANPSVVTTVPGTQGVTVNPSTNRYYMSNGYNGHILVYNGADNAQIASVNKGYCPAGFDSDPTTNLIYSASQCGGGNDPLQVLNGATNTILYTGGSGGVSYAVHVNRATGRAYVNASSHTRVYGPSPNFGVLTDLSGIHIHAVNLVTNRLYSRSGSDLQVRDGNDHSLLATITGIGTGGGVGVNTSRNRLYVPDTTNNVIKIVDGGTNALVDSFSLGTGVSPGGSLAVDSTKHRIYIVGTDCSEAYSSGTSVAVSVSIPSLISMESMPRAPRSPSPSALAPATNSRDGAAASQVLQTLSLSPWMAIRPSPLWPQLQGVHLQGVHLQGELSGSSHSAIDRTRDSDGGAMGRL